MPTKSCSGVQKGRVRQNRSCVKRHVKRTLKTTAASFLEELIRIYAKSLTDLLNISQAWELSTMTKITGGPSHLGRKSDLVILTTNRISIRTKVTSTTISDLTKLRSLLKPNTFLFWPKTEHRIRVFGVTYGRRRTLVASRDGVQSRRPPR